MPLLPGCGSVVQFIAEHIEWLRSNGVEVLPLGQSVFDPEITRPIFNRGLPGEYQAFYDSELWLRARTLGLATPDGGLWHLNEGLDLSLTMAAEVDSEFPVDPVPFLYASEGDVLVIEGSGERMGWLWSVGPLAEPVIGPFCSSLSQYLRASRELFDMGYLRFNEYGQVVSAKAIGDTGPWPPDDTPGPLLGDFFQLLAAPTRPLSEPKNLSSFSELMPWYTPVHLDAS